MREEKRGGSRNRKKKGQEKEEDGESRERVANAGIFTLLSFLMHMYYVAYKLYSINGTFNFSTLGTI